jgi:CubicO group peptidase (beta-lactamase class C family)
MFRALVLLPLSCLPLAAQKSPDLSTVGKQVKQILAADRVPGMAIAVTRHGQIVWEQGFGWADRERHVQATANTPFYLASVTKSLTSTAVMVLQQSGNLDLDTAINKYLGPAKLHSPMWNANEATVRRVATHMGGLTTFYRACEAEDTHCNISINEEIARYGILFWPPAERFDYSNLGYAILGEAVAHASKQSFAQFLQERVFQPLGMKHCSLTKPSDGSANYDQHSHQRTLDQISGSPGASAAYCSAHDLALFAMFHLKDHLRMQRKILQDAALDALHRPVTHLEGPQYAMGWWTDNRAGEPVVFGQGGTNDSFTLVELFPVEDMAVVMLANSWGDDLNMPNAIEKAILAKVLPSIHRRPEATTSPEVARVAPAQLVGTWTGRIATYTGGVPVTITILRSGDVHGHVGDVPDAPLRNVSSGGEHVYGILSGDLQEDDAAVPSYDIELDMFLRGAKLAGAATTRPGAKSNTQLPHWIDMERTQ